ncbi:PepSY domain-containing protein [Elioraea rosea]|uniref:PepSY domain-containing protein n=1 Tax=Elioraea rosea TaxID=2492390 RepID=UPI001315AC2F|nr:PepSY domain-containing protein [Elioraea rosea]
MPRLTRLATSVALAGSAILIAAVLLFISSPARADDDCRGMPVTRAQAIAIAQTVGLVRVEEVDCDDDEWEVEGRSASGREMEVEIDARSGQIKEIEYD